MNVCYVKNDLEKEEITPVSPLTTMSKTRDYRSLLYTARFNIFVLSLLTLYIYKTCYTFQEQNEPMYFSKNEFTALCFFTYLADNAILFVFSC